MPIKAYLLRPLFWFKCPGRRVSILISESKQKLHWAVTLPFHSKPVTRDESVKEMAGGKLHLFSIYTDFGAHRRIKWTVNAIEKLAGLRWHCSSEMWKVDSLNGSESMKRMLARDGANADILIAMIGSLDRQRPELVQWLDSLVPLEPHRSGLLIGLLGDEEDHSEALDWTAAQLIRCAQKTNRKFIWHWMGHHAADNPAWLADGIHSLLAEKQQLVQPLRGSMNPMALQEAV